MKFLLLTLLALWAVYMQAGLPTGWGHRCSLPHPAATLKLSTGILHKSALALPPVTDKECRRGQNRLIAGAAVLGFGATAFTAGVVVGSVGLNYLFRKDGYMWETGMLMALIAVPVSFLGIAGIGIGVPVLLSGKRRIKQYCGKVNAKASLQLFHRGNTAGLALRF